MAEKEFRIKGSTIAVIVIAIVLIGIIWYTFYYVPPAVVPPKYTTGLLTKFDIYDTATYALLDTGDVSVEFYPAGTDPLSVLTFTVKPIRTATYSTVIGHWTAPLNMGTYTMLVKKGTTAIYPELIATVKVPGTDSEDKEVWLEPSQVDVYERATTTITKSILAYNITSGAYDISAATLNTTTYDKWLVTFTFTVSGEDKIIKAGRVYQTKVSGVVPTEYSLDGALKTAVLDDIDASDDAMTGYYTPFLTEWEGGELHRLDVYFDDYAATGLSGTITVKLFEYYACVNRAAWARWWTDTTTTLTVEA